MFTVYSEGCLSLKSLFSSTVTVFCVTICVKCMYTGMHICVYTVYRYTSINLPHCFELQMIMQQIFYIYQECTWDRHNSEFTEEAVTWNRRFSRITFSIGNYWVQFQDLWQTAGEIKSESFLLNLKLTSLWRCSTKVESAQLTPLKPRTLAYFIYLRKRQRRAYVAQRYSCKGWTHTWNKLTRLPWRTMPTFALAPKWNWALLLCIIFTSRVSWKQ